MDVSSLLNAAPAGANVYEGLKPSPRISPKRSSSTTPTLATARHVEGSSDLINDAGRDVDEPFLPRSATRGLDSGGYGQSFTGREQTVDLRPMILDKDFRLEGHDGGCSYQGSPEGRFHRCSDSQGSISSYESTPSQAHSRTSSVTTVGDDNVASVSYAEAFDDAKLATVHEETSLRAQTKDGEHSRDDQLPRPSLMINTDTSNGRNGRRRRNSRTMSNIRGARSSGGLAGCTLLPPTYGRYVTGP